MATALSMVLFLPNRSLMKIEINIDDQAVNFTYFCNGRQAIIKLTMSLWTVAG